MLPTHFLTDDSPMTLQNAVAAIIVAEDGSYLLQLRDDIPRIFYPGHWSCFGGAVEPGEAPAEALVRELDEEIGLRPDALTEFARFDFAVDGTSRSVYRRYFEVRTTRAAAASLVQHEGAGMDFLAPTAMFSKCNIAPYDSFALWLHLARDRLN